MRQSKHFKSYEEVKQYIESLSLEEHMQFCENEILDSLSESEGNILTYSEDEIPVFNGSFEDMIREYNAVTPENLLDFATAKMKIKLNKMERKENNRNSEPVNESVEKTNYP